MKVMEHGHSMENYRKMKMEKERIINVGDLKVKKQQN